MSLDTRFLLIGKVLKADVEKANITALGPRTKLNDHITSFAGKYSEELKTWFKDYHGAIIMEYKEQAGDVWMLKINPPMKGKVHFPVKFLNVSWIHEIDLSTSSMIYRIDFSRYLDEMIITDELKELAHKTID